MSEVRQEGNLKFLYKLKVDEAALKKRNVNPKPTEYRKRTMAEEADEEWQGDQITARFFLDTGQKKDVFESEFEKETEIPQYSQPIPEEEPDPDSVFRKQNYSIINLNFLLIIFRAHSTTTYLSTGMNHITAHYRLYFKVAVPLTVC